MQYTLSYYVGKVCTVLTQQPNFTVSSEKIHAQYFTGLCKQVNNDGIWLEHIEHKTMAYYPLQGMLGIIEERLMTDVDIEKIKKPAKSIPDTASTFIPIEQLKNLRR